MADNTPFQQVHEATCDLIDSYRETGQAVVDSLVAVQDHNLRFTQNIFVSWTELLTRQTGSVQHWQQQRGQQTRKQQEAFQRLASTSMQLYLDFLLAPLTLSRKLVEASMTTTQREREPVP